MDDSARWLELHRATVRELYGFVSRRCAGDRVLAEDVVQETYLRALAFWQEGERPERPLAWLQTVARHLLHDHYRRAQPGSLDAATVDLAIERPVEADAEAREATELLQHGLSRMPPRAAGLLEGFYFEGLDTQALADRNGLSPRAVEGRLRRARRKLRKLLLTSSLRAPQTES